MRRLHSPKPGTIFLLLFLGATMADDDDHEGFFHHNRYKQDINSKIMITAIVSLIAVIFLVVILHIYARYLLRRQARRGAAFRGVSFEFRSTQVQSVPPKTGLDAAVIALLPLFTFKDMDRPNESNNTECAVCLSSIDDEEMARLLPNCNHIFHVECIDMWLGSHSTCPICRTGAEPQSETETTEPVEGAPPTAPPMEAVNSTSSTSLEGTSGGAAAQSVKVGESGSRLSSFRRMLSRDRSSRRVQSCGQGDGNLDDIERQ